LTLEALDASLDSPHRKAHHGNVMDRPSAPNEQPERQPYPGEQQTRLSGAGTALVIGVVALVL
jgi:hypothetical protein